MSQIVDSFFYLETAPIASESILILKGFAIKSTIEVAGIPHILSCLAGSEEVEAIDEMTHQIRIDGVAFLVATHRSVNGTTNVAALIENVVSSKCYRCVSALEEAITGLRIPNELVGIHFGGTVSSA